MTAEHDNEHDSGLTVHEQTADWFLRLQAQPDDDGLRARFGVWLSQAPEHALAWRETDTMWRALGEAPVHYRRLSPATGTVKGKVHRAGIAATGRRRTGRWIAGGTVTAMSLCLLLLALPSIMIRVQADYITTTAETRSVTLEDGSQVVLGAGSAISSSFRENRRQVTLLAGEALFDVQRDVTRPFVVEAAGAEVEVLGTVFDVRMTQDSTDVALARGKVRASSGKIVDVLAPGDLLTIDRKTGAMAKDVIAIDDIGSWREGRLYVTDASVGAVIELLQRYHPAWITIPDSALARERVNGIYDLRNPDQALRALVDPHGGKVRAVSSLLRVVTRL